MSPPHVFLLPPNISDRPSTIITLPHPRTLAPTRYLLHPTEGLHEITKLTPPSSTPRSWLLAPSIPRSPPPSTTGWLGSGQILQDGSMYMCTPIDPLFAFLPQLFPPTQVEDRRFLPIEDLLDGIVERGEGNWEEVVVKAGAAQGRIKAVCESVDVGGGEKAYRANVEKLMQVLAKKCLRMAQGGLPGSMEEGFVSKALSRPMAQVLAEEAEKEEEEKENISTEDASKLASRSTRLPDASEEIKNLLRVRVAGQFLCATYLPNHVASLLSTHLESVHDFTLLDSYLAALTKLRHEAAAMRSDDFSLKRSVEEDEELGERKRKKKEDEEAEKKKKKNVSRGVRDLQKVDTKGMAKMTSFFKKKAVS